MKINLKWAFAAILSTALGGSSQVFAQSFYNISDGGGPVQADDGTPSCACEAEEEEATCDPWRLFPEIGCGWKVYGWLNASATANADAPASHYNGPVTLHDREGVTVNQLYGIVEKVADTGGCGTAFGGRVDLMWGSDYIFTQATGLETHQDGTNKWNGHLFYGAALPQAYAEVAVNRLSLKLGHFYALMGYQVVPATGNFFATQPYTFQYGEPFTHTGLLANWKANDEWMVHAALVNGWDKFDAQTDKLAFMFGGTYTPTHGKYTIFDTAMVGEEDGTALPIVGTRFINGLVFTYNVSDKTQYVFQTDFGYQEDGAGVGNSSEWYGVNQYLFYTVNECWKLGARAEWFRDSDGIRLAGAPPRLNTVGGAGGYAGTGLGLVNPTAAQLAGDYFEVALGANWTPSSNLVIRPEFRWDWSDGTAAAPYDDLTKDSQFLAIVDAIIHF